MRSEFFKKIQESRSNYYSELKSREIKKEISKGNVKQVLIEPIKVKEKKKSKGKGILRNQFIKSSSEAIVISSQLKQKLNKIIDHCVRANKKVKSKSDQLADGFYNFSSRIFDDKYNFEDHENPPFRSVSLILQNGDSMVGSIGYEEKEGNIMNDLSFLPDIFQVWVRTMLMNIFLWFNADEIEEIGSMKQSVGSNDNMNLQYKSRVISAESAVVYYERSEDIHSFNGRNEEIKDTKNLNSKNSIKHVELYEVPVNLLKRFCQIFFSSVNRFVKSASG